jgi:multiple sugar transport system permease protein
MTSSVLPTPRAKAKPGSNPLARGALYAVLIVFMAFPFLWMVITSFQSMQESLQAKPVWFPNRLNPANWLAARGLGEAGGDATWGGLQAGNTATLELRARQTDPSADSAQFAASVPDDSQSTSSGFLFGAEVGTDNTDPRAVSVQPGTPENGSLTWRVSVKNEGDALEAKVPLSVTLPEGFELVSTTLPPDRRSRNDVGAVYEWSNVAPGFLGYVLENYRDALRAAPFGRYFLNSIVNAVAQVVLGLIVVTLAAFAFAKIPFWGREALFALILSSLVIPGEMLLIPNFVTVFKLGWLDSYPGIVVPWIASVFGIFLLRQFFLSLPNELFEAARMDGAGYGTLLTRVALPLAVPGLVTFGIFSFLGSWNALLWPLIVTNKEEMKTLQNGLQSFIGEAGSNYGQLMAASLMVITPIIVGFLFAQKQFIAGVARSGLK